VKTIEEKLNSPAVRMLMSPVIFLAGFCWLLYCAVPTIYWGDSAEMVTVSCDLGVAHSPGYPLFAQLARLFGGLPFEHYPFRINVMSVFAAALAVLLIFHAVRIITVQSSPASSLSR